MLEPRDQLTAYLSQHATDAEYLATLDEEQRAELMQSADERIEELEAGHSGTPVKFYLPNLSEDSIWKLGQWSERIGEHAKAFGDWLHDLVVEEIYRRASEKPIEAKTPSLPTGWTNEQLAAALGCCFGLLESNQDRGLDDFLHRLSAAVVTQCRVRLKQSGN